MNNRLIVFIVLAGGIISSCEKAPSEQGFETVADRVCGEYALTEVRWTGPAVDLDNDGSLASFQREAGRSPGFVEDWIQATVSVASGQETELSVDAVVPVFHFLKVGEETVPLGWVYQQMQLGAIWQGEERFGSVSIAGPADAVAWKSAGVYRIDPAEQTFEIQVKNYLFDYKSSSIVEGVIIYCFQKIPGKE